MHTRVPLCGSRRIWIITAVVMTISAATSCHRGNSVSANTSIAPASSGSAVQSYADTVDHSARAVVTIRAARRMRAPQQFPFFDNPFFRQFFGNRSERTPQANPTAIELALGSGVIVNADG